MVESTLAPEPKLCSTTEPDRRARTGLRIPPQCGYEAIALRWGGQIESRDGKLSVLFQN